MGRTLKRISTVILADIDDLTARQIQGGIEAFVKENFGIRAEDIEAHYRTIFVNGMVKKNGEKNGQP